ncbi:MAG: hypothetical protein ACE5IP_05050 [Terriglobia bacterium]
MKCSAVNIAILGALLLEPCPTGGETPSDRQREAAASGRIAVVVSARNPVNSLESAELRRIFLREKTQWPNGWPITVYERSIVNPIREQFSRIALGSKPSELRQHWLRLQLTRGMRAPRACSSTALLKRYLERVKGGVGYMYLEEADDAVKVVKILEVRH